LKDKLRGISFFQNLSCNCIEADSLDFSRFQPADMSAVYMKGRPVHPNTSKNLHYPDGCCDFHQDDIIVGLGNYDGDDGEFAHKYTLLA
jgi:hypothetical protein